MKRIAHQFIWPALAALALFMSGCDSGGNAGGPNIVLITLDAFRADSLAAYGGPQDVAPNLNALADRGVVFENAYTVMGTTWPAHASMLTGLYPRMHGVRRNGHVLPDAFVSVAEVLRDAGYRTGSFVSYPQMHFVGNLGQGFEALSDRHRGDFEGHSRDGAETTAMATQWLEGLDENDGTQPFFLWFHLFDAHGPYRINDWSRERLKDYDGVLKDGATMDLLLGDKEKMLATPADARALKTLYEGEVHKTDRHVGELLQVIESLGAMDDTVFIITADHGQAVGEQGRTGHGPVLWESVLRIPLIIVDGRKPSTGNVATIVGAVDMGQTVLDYAGLSTDTAMQGRSLRPAVDGEELPAAPYYAEVSLREEAGDWYDPDRIAIYDSGFKMIYGPDTRQLFDLQGGADQLKPLRLGDNRTVADYLAGLAQDYLARETQSQEAELSDEDLETLRSLGYIQ